MFHIVKNIWISSVSTEYGHQHLTSYFSIIMGDINYTNKRYSKDKIRLLTTPNE